MQPQNPTENHSKLFILLFDDLEVYLVYRLLNFPFHTHPNFDNS